MINALNVLDIIALVIALLTSLILHENAHGVVALFMGDDTAKTAGRLSLNPVKHLSLIGTISLFLFRFGWAKPVPINPNKFRKKRLGNFLVSIAGISTNLILAILFTFIANILMQIEKNNIFLFFINTLVNYFIIYNVFLGVFNLIPIPPLDGSKIIYSFLPEKWVYKLSSWEQYTNLILIFLIFTGTISKIVRFLAFYVFQFLSLL